jgi:hypothetical protein
MSGLFWRLSDFGQAVFMGGFMLAALALGILTGNALADDVFGPRKRK